MNICIFGASSEKLEKRYYNEAEAMGRLIALNGHTLIFGGGNDGIMGSCANGAKTENGRLIGIAPKFFDEPDILFGNCDEFVFTETMEQRKQLMLDRADAFVALAGGIGTYEELFSCLTLKQLGRHSKPIVLLNTLGCFDKLIAVITDGIEKGFIGHDCLRLIESADTPEDVIKHLSDYKPITGSTKRICDYCR